LHLPPAIAEALAVTRPARRFRTPENGPPNSLTCRRRGGPGYCNDI